MPAWEEYHTGSFTLGLINGPCEGLIFAIGCMMVSSVMGTDFWRRPVHGLIPSALFELLPRGLNQWLVIDWLRLGFIGMLVVMVIPSSLIGVIRYYLGRKSIRMLKSEKKEISMTGRKWSKTLSAAIFQLILPSSVMYALFLWIFNENSTILSGPSPLLFCVFFFAFGLSFTSLTGRIVYAHMIGEDFPVWWWCHPEMLPLIVISWVTSWTKLGIFENVVIIMWFLFALISVGYWAWHIMSSICMHLGISCLRIPHSKNC